MITAPAWTDEDTVDLITDCLDNHHDMDVTFHHHAHHIVEALRRAGLLGNTLTEMREELAGLSERATQMLGPRFAFLTSGVWPAGKNHKGVSVYLHMHQGRAAIFSGDTFLDAIAAADKWLDEQDPRRLEREGWAILGVEQAA